MPAEQPTILATSGGFKAGSRTNLEFHALVHHAVDLSGATKPKVCHVGTANGDQRSFQADLDEAARLAGWEFSHLNLFVMPPTDDIAGFLLEHDVVWVGGGSVANLLAVWDVHGVGPAMRRAWESGVVLGGVSAGSICWHAGGATDSFGPDLRVVTNGLALLPYGNGVHYDSEARRRPTIHAAVASGVLPKTYCTDDGAGLLYRGTELVEAVSERRNGGAYVVDRDGSSGIAQEETLDIRRL
ncbi:peptidase E [Actinosynnema sp. NPDC047251]|uniref:Peptidase S51, dipeptidase E n=1 Tax=Saccharothrix espanaensis (strain ATCC 51144 / DSM 44229 / JCM 9112 / NBRC 15066 / NRRL 15764) TaxID=1179773 RepID=K0JTG9_SACES|nr:peptidase E [Saccharothrix espanaensis]CCH28842.1 Peptidase S51, dipeptidase E [Saccharothrix espanaensis DSM 44229]